MRYYLLYAIILLVLSVSACYLGHALIRGWWKFFLLAAIIILAAAVSAAALKEYFAGRKK